ncbi:protein CASC1-like, partial [Contarinia nasturtii]|uniref:protein CASC1-like n=1 Tax=Contarinia nasturtii TaxID=265458 RepID=UPI0012D3EC41
MGKKKMSKEERKKYEAEKAEALRIEMEKERQRQLEEERNLKLKQLSEARDRQKREFQENKMRRVQLAESCAFFKEISEEIEEIHAEQRKLQEWKRYMRCNGLPNAYDPGDLRKYLHMWQMECDRYNENEQNWLLRTDERTILTQNRNIENATKVYLQQQQPILGDVYSKRTLHVLGILEEIDEAIEQQPTTLRESIISELHRLKLELRHKLIEYIDDFSFKILSNIDRDMKLEGLLIATHFYECDVFKSHLWTKRDIPQPLLNEKERQKEAKNYISIDFPSIRLNLSLPPSVKCKNGAIRGMWLNYDHFSDFCPSFYMPGDRPIKMDLNEAAKKEWAKRKELEKVARIENDTKSKANDGAVPFDNFELLNMPIVDVDKLYMDYINDIIKKDRYRKGRDVLNLKEFEINLRQYRIVGGIYCLDYFEQPEQSVKLSAKSYLRTIGGSKSLKRRQFFQYFRMPDPIPAGVRRLPEEVETEMKAIERGLSKLSYVTITLPDDIIWFEPPTVCRWEVLAETDISERIKNKPPTDHLKTQRSIKTTS